MITTKWETITPALAAEYLKMNKNRHLQEGYARRLADQMSAGQWKETHQGIAFNCDGSLRDGQHRLRAVIICGIPQRFLVSRGVSDDATLVMDTHKTRSDSDAFKLIGFEIDQRTISMCRSAYFGMSGQGKAVSRQTLLEFVQKHEAAIHFVKNAMRLSRGLTWPFPAVVMAPVLRAYYTADRDRLAHFVDVLINGTANGEQDHAATAMNRFLGARHRGGVSSGDRTELYRKCEATLQAFLDCRPLTKVYGTTQELFPLPEETE